MDLPSKCTIVRTIGRSAYAPEVLSSVMDRLRTGLASADQPYGCGQAFRFSLARVQRTGFKQFSDQYYSSFFFSFRFLYIRLLNRTGFAPLALRTRSFID